MAFSPENIRAHPRKEHNPLHASKLAAQTSMKFHETFKNHFTCFDRLHIRAGPEKSESVRDSRIGRIMIHHVGWKGGRHGWQNPIRRIYVTAWYWRFYQVNPGAMWLAGLMSVRAA